MINHEIWWFIAANLQLYPLNSLEPPFPAVPGIWKQGIHGIQILEGQAPPGTPHYEQHLNLSLCQVANLAPVGGAELGDD